MRRITIGVIGSASRSSTSLSPLLLDQAKAVGQQVAEHGAVLLTGGTGGVMAAACEGAQAAGGLTVGFLPQHDFSQANAYLDLAFPTGMGTMRNLLTARCCDALIMLGGGVGTLNELTVAYDVGTPIVVVQGSGGWSDRLAPVLLEGRWLDERQVVEVSFALDAPDAVSQALARIHESRATDGLRAFAGAAGE